MSHTDERDSESRTSQRFPVHLNVKLGDGQGGHETQAAITGNMSAAGAYLLAEHSMPVGSAVEFEVMVPKDVAGGQSDVRLRCQGRVVRNDNAQEDGKTGVACVIDSYEIVRAQSTTQEEGC